MAAFAAGPSFPRPIAAVFWIQGRLSFKAAISGGRTMSVSVVIFVNASSAFPFTKNSSAFVAFKTAGRAARALGPIPPF